MLLFQMLVRKHLVLIAALLLGEPTPQLFDFLPQSLHQSALLLLLRLDLSQQLLILLQQSGSLEIAFFDNPCTMGLHRRLLEVTLAFIDSRGVDPLSESLVVPQQPIHQIFPFSVEGLLEYFSQAAKEMFLIFELLEDGDRLVG